VQPRYVPPSGLVLQRDFPVNKLGKGPKRVVTLWRKLYSRDTPECPLVLFSFAEGIATSYVQSKSAVADMGIHCSCWSQVLFLNTGSNWLIEDAYKAFQCHIMNFPTIVHHIKFVSSLPVAMLQAWHETPAQPNECLEAHPQMVKALEMASAKLFAPTANAAGENGSAENQRALATLKMAQVFPLDEDSGHMWPTLVSSEMLFSGLSSDVPPFAYSMRQARDVNRGCIRLLEMLGMNYRPSFEQVIRWLEILREKFGTSVLPEQELTAAITLVKIAFSERNYVSVEIQPQELAKCPLPDKGGILSSPTAMVFDDAPWLKSRLDTTKLPLVHPNISDECAAWYGVVPLSKGIKEIPDEVTPLDESLVPAEVRKSLELWTHNISSTAFRYSVLRAGSHAHNKTARQFSEAQLSARLKALRRVRMVAAKNIKSKFLLTVSSSSPGEKGKDVTGASGGSPALLHAGPDVIASGQPSLFYVLYGDEETRGSRL